MASSGRGENDPTPTSTPVASSQTVETNQSVINTSHLTDPGWAHCTALTNDKKKVRCNHCGKEMVGGINRLKHHIARIPGDATVCPKVSNDVAKQMKEILNKKKESKKIQANRKRSWGDFGEGNCDDEDEDDSNASEQLKRMKGKEVFHPNTVQLKLPTVMDMNARTKVVEMISRWFFHAAIPFNAADSVFFPKVIEAVGSYGTGMKAPTPHEILGPFLEKEVSTIECYFKELRESWASTGCSIISDGWTDQRGRSIINFLVSCTRGTMFIKSVDVSSIVKDVSNIFNLLDGIVEEVGEANIVQVITDNAANYVAAGKLLMSKRKHLFWTSCAAHNVDLMLEKIGKLKSVSKLIEMAKKAAKFIYNHGQVLSLMRIHTKGREIVRPGATRFATNFILTGSLLEQRAGLKFMMLSEEWVKSRYASMVDGREVEKILLDNDFWRKLEKLQNSITPLLQLLRIVDGDKQPAMGLIYDAIDKAKLAIKEVNDNKREKYMKFWKVIDERWESTLHSPLHAAGYFLNPALRYRSEFSSHPEVRRGLQKVISLLEPNEDNRIDVIEEISLYEKAQGDFGTDMAIKCRSRVSPISWWENYGLGTPILQRLAIRVLSQVCSSTGCERNWSTFDQIHTKKRNRLRQEKVNKLVFVHYNLRLREQQLRRHASDYDPTLVDHIMLEEGDDEWVGCEPGDSSTHIDRSEAEANDLNDINWLDACPRGESAAHGSETLPDSDADSET